MNKVAALSTLIVLGHSFTGCVYLTGEKTYWTKEYNDAYTFLAGPGYQDAKEQRFESVKYKEDNGKCIAIGMFPGYAHVFRKGYPEYRDGYAVDGQRNAGADEVVYVFAIPWLNLFLGAPTISSLLFEPFSDYGPTLSKFSEFGIIGVHKWKEGGGAKLKIDEEFIERVIVARGTYRPEGKVPSWISKNRVKIYFTYPGFDVIVADINHAGRVDVVHDDGVNVRRFEKAKKADGKITYSDYKVAADIYLKKRVEFRNACKGLLTHAQAVLAKVSSPKAKREVAAAIDDINERMDSPAPGTDMFSDLDQEWMTRTRQRLHDAEFFSDLPSREKQDAGKPKVSIPLRSEFDL